MYVEKKYNFNWLSLFIKVIIIVIFVLFAIWICSNVILRISKNEQSNFNTNINNMKSVAIEYFDIESKPTNTGESKKITLQELINNKYILPLTDTKGKECDNENSYAEITNIDSYYSLRIELSCGKNTDYIYTKIKK